MSTPFPTPRFKHMVYLLSRAVGGLYVRLALGINASEVRNKQTLDQEIHDFKAGRQALILAFRHTAKEDAPTLLASIKSSHLCFLYGRDVLNWAGKGTKYLFPRLGFVPVQNRGNNRDGLTYLRNEVVCGRFPITLAPEGQVTYHSRKAQVIEAGVATLAMWALQGGRHVTILPIAVGYDYHIRAEQLLQTWEKRTGVKLASQTLDERLVEAGYATLWLTASFFNLKAEASTEPFFEQRDALCRRLLARGEYCAGIHDAGASILDRLFKLRFTGEDILFDPEECSTPLEQEKLAYDQQQARQFLRISQTVDVLEYLDPYYPECKDDKVRQVEIALNLLDVINRLEGGTIDTRFSPNGKRATILVGNPIHLEPSELGVGRKQLTASIKEAVQQGLLQASVALDT